MADVTYTSTDVKESSVDTVETGQAGEAVTAGQAIFLDATDSLIYKANADSSAGGLKPDSGDKFGIALSTAAIGQTVAWCYRPGDKVEYSASTFVRGLHYVVSNTAGGIMSVAGLKTGYESLYLGYAESDTVLAVYPRDTGVDVS